MEQLDEVLDHVTLAESLVVLEDLRAKQYGKRHFSNGLSLSECFVAIEQIGKFHAVTWIMYEVAPDKLKWDCLRHNGELIGIYSVCAVHVYITHFLDHPFQ